MLKVVSFVLYLQLRLWTCSK